MIMARTSANPSTARRLASSPQQSSDRGSLDPAPRRRITRSQSIDLDASNDRPSMAGGARRSARQASVESDISSTSVDLNRLGRSKKGGRVAVVGPDLSMVAEIDEDEGNEEREEDEEDEEEEEKEEDDDEDIQSLEDDKPGSPTAYSQISGTTEVTSASISMMDLEFDFVEDLPDLLTASRKILDHLAPPGTTEEDIDTLMTELKKVGSAAGKRLNHREEKFDIDMRKIGLDGYNEEPFTFIRIDLMLGKLFRAEDLTSGDFNLRPDAIFQAANLATMVRHFVAAQRESRRANTYLARLDDAFPRMFVSHFDQEIQFGNSDLLEPSFRLALEIRTQLTITDLLHGKEREDWSPEKMLADNFFNAPDPGTPTKTYYKNSYEDGVVRPILNSGDVNSIAQNKAIRARVKQIRKAFRQGAGAVEVGDLVNFEYLMAEFPWTSFVTELVQWSRLRLDEINTIINSQGGVDHIMQAIIPAIRAKDSQVDISYRPTPLADPVPLTKPAGHGRSFLGAGLALEQRIERAKARQSFPSSSSVFAQPTSSLRRPDGSSLIPEPDQQQELGDFGPSLDQGTDHINETSPGPDPRPASEYVHEWDANENEQNKENIHGKAPTRRRLIDPQPGARRLAWDSDDEGNARPYKPVGSSPKRNIDQINESEQSEEEGFQQDNRAPDPSKRTAAPPGARRAPTTATQPSKRPRIEVEPDQEANIETERRENRRRVQEAMDTEDDDDDDEPPPTAMQVREASKSKVARKRNYQPQSRVPWSEADEQHLIELIEVYGCSWATIAKVGNWERGDQGTNQVGLKDKAHNIKVVYLKEGVRPPFNFDQIKLRKKELDAVRLVDPGYED